MTGGGRGIGRAIALSLAWAGADVAISSRSEDELESVADEVRGAGPRGLPVQADVRSFDDITAGAEMILREFPEELGPMAVLLASEEAGGITGQVISVDGGYKV